MMIRCNPWLLFWLVLFLIAGSSPSFSQKPRLVIPAGHTNPVNSMTLSHDGKILVSSDQSPSIKVWDLETKTELYSLNAHLSGVNEVCFSPTANLLASASDDKSVILWSMVRATKQSTLEGHQDVVTHVRFTKNGEQLISSSFDGTIKIWNPNDATLIRQIEIGNPVHSLALSESNEYLACGTRLGEIVLISLVAGKKEKTIPVGATINDIQFSVGGGEILAGDVLGKVHVVDIATGKVSKVIQLFSSRVYKIAMTEQPDRFVAVGRDAKMNFSTFSGQAGAIKNDFNILTGLEAGSELGIYSVVFNKQKTKLYLPNYMGGIYEIDTKQGVVSGLFKGKASPISSISIDRSGRFLSVASNASEIVVLDLTGATDARIVKGHKGTVRTVAFHPSKDILVSGSDDKTIKSWNTESWVPTNTFPTNPEYAGTSVYFSSLADGFFKKTTDAGVDLHNLFDNKKKSISIKNLFDYRVGPNDLITAKAPNTVFFYENPKYGKPSKLTIEGIASLDFGMANAIVTIDGNRVRIFDAITKNETSSFELSSGKGSDRIKVIAKKNWAITWNTSAGKFGAKKDNDIKIWDLKNGNLISSLEGHEGSITAVEVLKDRFLFSSSIDGTIRIWTLDELETKTSPFKATLIPLDSINWVVTTEVGLFDATQSAMRSLHYVQGAETIDIDQLKQTYYEPSLLPKILGYNNEPIRTAKNLTELALYPEINLQHPSLNNGKLGIQLEDQGGGYGQIMVLINDKEVVRDLSEMVAVDKLRPEISMTYDLKNHPYIKEGELNKVSVKAYNKTGNIVSKPRNLYLLPTSNGKKQKPKLHALLVGVSDYVGTELDLSLAAKDATDLSKALTASANQYLGGDNIDVVLLTTDNKNPFFKPTKQNIKRALDLFAKNSGPNDILFLYLAGHGVNYGGTEGDFYFLTADAQSGTLTDDGVRNSVAISSLEFTELIKKIPATKQVMIIDACHSGQFLGDLSKNMSSSQVRAMETLKDKTGLYVLAGSAADALSYESGSFGHGILTYSLLYGIKGPALRENEFIDILKLFQFSIDKVPQLAAGIGGIQKPELRVPAEATSFDIGKMLEAEKNSIELTHPKPVFIRSDFREETEDFDVLDLSAELDTELRLRAKEGSGKIDFVDTRKFEDGLVLRGRYVKNGTIIAAKVRYFKGTKLLGEFEMNSEGINDLAKKIVEQVVKNLAP